MYAYAYVYLYTFSVSLSVCVSIYIPFLTIFSCVRWTSTLYLLHRLIQSVRSHLSTLELEMNVHGNIGYVSYLLLRVSIEF